MGVKVKNIREYQDYQSFWHDKPVANGLPSSNNGYIYSAYSKYLAPNTLNKDKITNRFNTCLVKETPLIVDRLPGKPLPPTSMDEIIGMVSLGLLNHNTLSKSFYNFCNINHDFDRKLSLKSILIALIYLFKIRKEHRNFFWENSMTEVYPLAFRLSPGNIYYVKKMWNVKPKGYEIAYFYASILFTYLFGNKSSRMVLWLQLEDMNNPLLKFLPKKKWINAYFNSLHPFHIED